MILRALLACIRRLFAPATPTHSSAKRLELAWTAADREATWGTALQAAPREGAVLALCRRSTGATRDTLIVQTPITPEDGDLSYARGYVVTVTARYLNRVIDTVGAEVTPAGVAVLHTHPGPGVPDWSRDDDVADADLAQYFFGEGFLTSEQPLLSIVVSDTAIRAREITYARVTGRVEMRPVQRVRTLSPSRFEVCATREGGNVNLANVPAFADRSVRVFGREGQRMLANLHVAIVGTGGVGSILADHLARYGVGQISMWDPDIVKDVNVNRSSVFTFEDARRRVAKVIALARALPSFALVREFKVTSSVRDVRTRGELPALLDADLIVLLVDDARPRHFINRLAYAHYIPVLDGGNVIRSTAEDDVTAENAVVEGGAVRISYLTPGEACLWCAGHMTAEKLSLASRPAEEIAADRARGYVENLGPEHAPSVMPVNALTAALLEVRLQGLLFGLSNRAIPEVYYSLLDGTLDELPRIARPSCRHCSKIAGLGDRVELPFAA